MQNKEIITQVNNAFSELIKHVIIRSGLHHKTPGLCSQILEYTLRGENKLRSLLFTIAYSELTGRISRHFFRCAASLELFHLFDLIQEDIIRSAEFRRGKRSLHKSLQYTFPALGAPQAQNMAFVFASLLYSAAIDAFLDVKENPEKKELSLKTVLSSSTSTTHGRFNEIIYLCEKSKNITLSELYELYDYITSKHLFITSMVAGAQLGGASDVHLNMLGQASLYFGRAYQITKELKIYSILKQSNSIQDTSLVNRTNILFWHLYNHNTNATRVLLKDHHDRTSINTAALIRSFERYGTIDFARAERCRMYNAGLNILTDPQFLRYSNFTRAIITTVTEHLRIDSSYVELQTSSR